MLLCLSLLDTREEKEKFTEIYQLHGHFCWYTANRILHDAQLSEDAVQETFLALTRHLDKVDAPDSPRCRKFLMTIAKSKALDILRKQHAGRESVVSEEELGELPDRKSDILAEYISRENYHRLVSCVLELEENYRVVFEYKYLHRLSDQEIADILEISPKAVNVRMFRARKKLQEMIIREVAVHG